jgi:membrane AbrB-like protein
MLFLSGIFVAVLEAVGLPAALLLGPMVAAIVVAAGQGTLRVPHVPFFMAQAVIGCMIARSITPEIIGTMAQDWPLFAAVIFSVIMSSALIGLLLTRWRVLPGTTAVWGSCPGAASAMTLMAEAFGADVRLVAFMQYLRVIIVIMAAGLIAGFFVDAPAEPAPARDWLAPIDPAAFGAAVAVIVAGSLAGRQLRLPSPYFLGSVILGGVVHLRYGVPLQVPPLLLAASYAVIGWRIGLNFTRTILVHAARSLPQIVGSILALVAFCGALAFLLSSQLGIDPLTAYLATSPGGLDSVAVIAAASRNVDLSFVMAMQGARLVIVLLVGPWLARLVTRWLAE